jgi:hypothetical protein
MAKISEEFPSKYLRAADLQGRQVAVIIDRTEHEELGNDRKLVLYFEGKQKGIVLNKTNAQTIVAAYGDDTDDWRGGELVLFSTMVSFNNQQVEAIRVKVPPRKPAAATRAIVTSGNRQLQASIADDPRQAMQAPLDEEVPF